MFRSGAGFAAVDVLQVWILIGPDAGAAVSATGVNRAQRSSRRKTYLKSCVRFLYKSTAYASNLYEVFMLTI